MGTCRRKTHCAEWLRQVAMVARLKARFPHSLFVGSGYSYLQEYLPHVGQALVRAGMVDFIGLGRMVLSYPDLPLRRAANGPTATPRHLPHVFRLHDPRRATA